MSPPKTSPTLRKAIELLNAEAQAQLDRHPWGHLLAGRREALRLPLELVLNARPEELPKLAARAQEGIDEALQAVLAHQAVVRPGHVYCLRCAGAELSPSSRAPSSRDPSSRTPSAGSQSAAVQHAPCQHTQPPGSQDVFTGYGPTGIPRFTDLGQWLLERQDPRVDDLYQEPPRLVTVVSTGPELTGEVLSAYRDQQTGYRLHGQVAAGWFSLPDPQGNRRPMAVTLQIVSTHGRRGSRGHPRFTLNVVCTGPDGESLEELYGRIGKLPWAGPLRWGQEALASVEAAAARRRPGQRTKSSAKRSSGKKQQQRLEGILGGIARRLEKGRRAHRRRTQHAQQRHDEGGRPTSMALADLRVAGAEQLLFDTRQETLVVLGERGRAHVFNPEGKLVTSVRYAPPAIERRRQNRRWRPATAAEIATLEKHLGMASGYRSGASDSSPET
ncbi:MAG: hypothetical protein SX243_19780 [Acidobacteriota bacterium]|nr:hypothetical protein [Acidobacteriota bacterium]